MDFGTEHYTKRKKSQVGKRLQKQWYWKYPKFLMVWDETQQVVKPSCRQCLLSFDCIPLKSGLDFSNALQRRRRRHQQSLCRFGSQSCSLELGVLSDSASIATHAWSFAKACAQGPEQPLHSTFKLYKPHARRRAIIAKAAVYSWTKYDQIYVWQEPGSGAWEREPFWSVGSLRENHTLCILYYPGFFGEIQVALHSLDSTLDSLDIE